MHNDQQSIQIVTLTGLGVNCLLTAVKAVVGIYTQSQATIADAIHSLSDCITDLAVIIGVKFWSEPADENHPHGHQRFEAIITLFIGVALGLVAFKLAGQAMNTILDDTCVEPGWPVFIAAVISILAKEILFHWTYAVGKHTHSAATMANAWHHRSDAFSSIPVAVTALLAHLFPGQLPHLDSIATVIVAILLFKAACNIAWPALLELADSSATKPIQNRIMNIIMDIKGVKDAHNLRTRRVGDAFSIDVHILVEPNLTVKQGHDICTEVSRRLEHDSDITIVDVLTHLEPWNQKERENP